MVTEESVLLFFLPVSYQDPRVVVRYARVGFSGPETLGPPTPFAVEADNHPGKTETNQTQNYGLTGLSQRWW